MPEVLNLHSTRGTAVVFDRRGMMVSFSWWRFVVLLLTLRSRDSVVGVVTTLLAG